MLLSWVEYPHVLLAGAIPLHRHPAADLVALQTGAVPATNEYTLLIIAFGIPFAGIFLEIL